jgi:hypothetical protein
MKEINLKLETKKLKCETISIKTKIVVEEGIPETVIPKKIRKEVEKLLIEELIEKDKTMSNNKQQTEMKPQTEIKKQINLLEEEQKRVKQFLNENNFNATTAPYVISKQYRDAVKKHIEVLKMNLEDH